MPQGSSAVRPTNGLFFLPLAPTVISLNYQHSVLKKKLPESITNSYYLFVGLSLPPLVGRMWLLIWLCVIKSEVSDCMVVQFFSNTICLKTETYSDPET